MEPNHQCQALFIKLNMVRSTAYPQEKAQTNWPINPLHLSSDLLHDKKYLSPLSSFIYFLAHITYAVASLQTVNSE